MWWSKLVIFADTSSVYYDTVHQEKMVIIVQVYVWGINSNYNLGLGHNSTRNNPELVEQFREAGQTLCFP
jgi:alpha-tubulin suppressor-like RCC1 family protein